MNDEFVFAVMKNSNNEYVVINSMPDSFDERETPYTAGEIEYVANRVVYDMQSKRMADILASRFAPEQQQVSKKVRAALDKRQKES